MRYLSHAHPGVFKNKRVLLRADFNIENPKDPAGLFRLDATIPTIKKLLMVGAKVIIMSHRGRPRNNLKSRNQRSKLSLRPLVPILKKKLKRRVVFLTALPRVVAPPNGRVFLMENLRFFSGEEKNDSGFARALAALGDVYVNDAFAVSHRKNASIVAITKFLPSYAGLLLEKEIGNLDKVMRVVRRPFTIVIGGAKTADKIEVLEYFSKKADWILLGGGPANTFLKAVGIDIGKSIYDPKLVSLARRMLRNENIILPVDFRKEKGRMLDIGPYTEKKFSEIIRSSKTILWNGPMGRFEKKTFARGSEVIAQAITKSRAFSVVGGGETVMLISQLGLLKKFDFVSTGGGAMLAYLAGEKLPGIAALQDGRVSLFRNRKY